MLKILQLMSEFCINFDTYLFVITRKKLAHCCKVFPQSIIRPFLISPFQPHATAMLAVSKSGGCVSACEKNVNRQTGVTRLQHFSWLMVWILSLARSETGGKKSTFKHGNWQLHSQRDTMRYTWFVCNLLCILTFLYHIKLTQIIKKQSSCFFILYFQIQSWVFPLTRAFPHVATFTVCATSVG